MSTSEPRQHLLSTSLSDFTAFCEDNGLKKFRARQIYQWVFERGVTDFSEMTNLPKDLRPKLAEQWAVYTSKIVRRQVSEDGTTKLLLQWPDDNTSECVLIPDGKRNTACISSQVGCPIGCRFCASGLDGLKRQLTVGQIVEQAMRVRDLLLESEQASGPPPASPSKRKGGGGAKTRTPDAPGPSPRLSNVVFMGLGEPLANYKNVIGAVRIINASGGMNIGARKITISTVGLPDQIRKLAHENLQINLAISLHAPNDKLRRQLIPWAKNVTLDDLVSAGRYFFDTTKREITVEYILLGGVNDRLYHANELVKLCRKMRCNVNLIRYNPVAGLGFDRPQSTDAHYFAERLRERGVNVHVRKSRGMDIDAACGQLRRRHDELVTTSGLGEP